MKLFVYGTLMKNQSNDYHLRDSTFICNDEIVGFSIINLGYFPAAVETSGTVKGEVYEITEECLNSCDFLERYPSMYNRTLKTTAAGHEAWIYYMPFIVNNDWNKYIESQLEQEENELDLNDVEDDDLEM